MASKTKSTFDQARRLVRDYTGEETVGDPSEEQRVEQLVAWVRERGRVREDAARLVVMTRAAGVSVE